MILKPRLLNFLSQKLLAPIPLLGKKLEHFFSEIAFIGQHPQVLFKALILSLFITILNFALYWVLLAPNLPETTSMMDVIFLLPIGLISIAIHITRITSYNVCYTKLLRRAVLPAYPGAFERHGSCESSRPTRPRSGTENGSWSPGRSRYES